MSKDKDVDMEGPSPSSEPTPEPTNKETLKADLDKAVKLLVLCVSSKEQRYAARALRTLPSIRRRLTVEALAAFITSTLAANKALASELIDALPRGEVKDRSASSAENPVSAAVLDAMPEIETYAHLLVVIYLLDNGDAERACDCAKSLTVVHAKKHQHRNTMDLVLARAFFYLGRTHERQGKHAQMRPVLLAALRTAALRRNTELQATLTNELLRSYLLDNLYDQADKLQQKTEFPTHASNNAWARHLYYLGRIKCVQLQYTAALDCLTQALRKAPPNSAVGFYQTVNKLLVLVNILIGDMPARSLFRQPKLLKPLAAYLELVRAVRSGDLNLFAKVVDTNKQAFEADCNFKLVLRLRQNVIRAGVRRINLSYSKISLQDVCQKLQLDSATDAEFIVAKAIRDGVIDATINHDKGYVESKDVTDVYSTSEPQVAFHERIKFCLDIHNDSVEAMRYPPKNYNRNESVEERLEREREEKEVAAELQDEFD